MHAQKGRQPRAGADKHRFKSHFEQFIDGQRLADDHIRLHVHAQFREVFDLLANDFLRQAELRDSVDQHAAGGVERLKDGHGVPFLRQIPRAGQPRGTGTDDGDLVSVRGGALGRLNAVEVVPIGDEPLKATDPDRFALQPADAFRLALRFLRADPSADGGQGGGAADDLVGALEVALLDLFDERRNLHVDRTTGHAGHIFTVQAAQRFVDGGRFVVAGRDFQKVVGAHLRRL